MTRPPQRFVAQLRTLQSPFTSQDAEHLFPKLRPSSVSVYLSHASKAGLIEQVGTKKFAHTRLREHAEPLPKSTQAIISRLRRRILPPAFEQLVVWSNESLAPFTHDAFPDPFVVIEGPRDALATIQEVLETDDVETALARSRIDLGRQLWDRDRSRVRVFLVVNAQLDGTKPSSAGCQVPTLSRLLVSVVHMPPIMPDAGLAIMEQPEFDLDEAIRATPSRRSAAALGAFFAWTRDKHPKHPVSRKVNDFINGTNGEW